MCIYIYDLLLTVYRFTILECIYSKITNICYSIQFKMYKYNNIRVCGIYVWGEGVNVV